MYNVSLLRDRFSILCWSLSPRRYTIVPDRESTPYFWLRIGLLPGWGKTRGDLELWNLCSITLMRPRHGLFLKVGPKA